MSLSYRNFSGSVETRFKPLDLCSNSLGYSVINCPELTAVAQNLVTEHIANRLGKHFDTLSAAARHAIDTAFIQFKDKTTRILNKDATSNFLARLEVDFDFSVGRDLVTDEENLGFANIYWRLVRANSPTDVGPVHADRWFWDLGWGVIPKGYRRVKIWMPLIQDDEQPSLMILPGSHEEEFAYDSREDAFGKRKPVFNNKEATARLIAASIKVGQAIVFHDNLLHGGRVSDVDRVSLEWTFGLKNGH
jgi:hypothetical protein